MESEGDRTSSQSERSRSVGEGTAPPQQPKRPRSTNANSQLAAETGSKRARKEAPAGSDSDDPAKNAGARSGKSVLSHVATEQRRRDRINDGFAALRQLIPHKDKADKATFLQQTVDYIKQLQGALQQLLSMGVVSNLPEDLQWNIRMLLPRDQQQATPAPAASATHTQQPAQNQHMAAVAAAQPNYLPYLLPAHQLALIAQQGQQGGLSAQALADAIASASRAGVTPLNMGQGAAQAGMSAFQAYVHPHAQQFQQAQQAPAATATSNWPQNDASALWLAHILQSQNQAAASSQMPGQPAPLVDNQAGASTPPASAALTNDKL